MELVRWRSCFQEPREQRKFRSGGGELAASRFHRLYNYMADHINFAISEHSGFAVISQC